MKNLYTLAISVFTILLIASCDSSTGSDGSFEVYRNGTWMVVSENDADWTGSPSKAKTGLATQSSDDTLLYAQPNGMSLRLHYEPSIEDQIFVLYRDSTITETTLDTTNLGYQVQAQTPFGPGYGSTGFQPVMGYDFGIPFHCDSSYAETDKHIYISNMIDGYKHGDPIDSTVVVKTVQFDVDGIYQTAKDLVCVQ